MQNSEKESASFKPRGAIAEEKIVAPSEVIVSLPNASSEPVHRPRLRQCNGAQLGNKRYEVERMLLEGEPKLKIARALKISAHSVRAVSRQMTEERYASHSGSATTSVATEPSAKSLPDRLRATAMKAVEAITSDKLGKASPQACAIVADRLLGRADAIETRSGGGDLIGDIMKQFGIQPSSSVSRVVVRERQVEVAVEGVPGDRLASI